MLNFRISHAAYRAGPMPAVNDRLNSNFLTATDGRYE